MSFKNSILNGGVYYIFLHLLSTLRKPSDMTCTIVIWRLDTNEALRLDV